MSGGLHRLIEGSMMTWIDEGELAVIQHMVYYCHECNGYHVRSEFTVGDVIAVLSHFNEEVQA